MWFLELRAVFQFHFFFFTSRVRIFTFIELSHRGFFPYVVQGEKIESEKWFPLCEREAPHMRRCQCQKKQEAFWSTNGILSCIKRETYDLPLPYHYPFNSLFVCNYSPAVVFFLLASFWRRKPDWTLTVGFIALMEISLDSISFCSIPQWGHIKI